MRTIQKQRTKESEISQSLKKLELVYKKMAKDCPNQTIKPSSFEKTFLKSRKKKLKAIKLPSLSSDTISIAEDK